VYWWRLVVGTIRRYRALRSARRPSRPQPSRDNSSEDWNRFIDLGWVQEWKPHHRRGGSLWVRRVGPDFQVFKSSRPGEPLYYVNGNLVYRTFGHPEGPSSVPWLAVRGRSVYPAEGYPAGPTERPLYRIEYLRKRNMSATIRPVKREDHLHR
jgi:hypothetical protein